MASETYPDLGRTIAGKFILRDILGTGAMGTVYRADQVTLGRTVAVKVLNPALARDPEIIQRFHQEARAASRINHPNTIAIIDFGETHKERTHSLNRTITWNANVVVLSTATAELIVDESGTAVTRTGGITITDNGSRIVVDNFTNNRAGNVRFTIDEIADEGPGIITGQSGTFTVRDALENLHIVNRSTKELEINAIDVINRTAVPTVTIDVEMINGGTVGFTQRSSTTR